jgi:hypothetical protein
MILLAEDSPGRSSPTSPDLMNHLPKFWLVPGQSAEVRLPARIVHLTLLPQSLVPPGVPFPAPPHLDPGRRRAGRPAKQATTSYCHKGTTATSHVNRPITRGLGLSVLICQLARTATCTATTSALGRIASSPGLTSASSMDDPGHSSACDTAEGDWPRHFDKSICVVCRSTCGRVGSDRTRPHSPVIAPSDSFMAPRPGRSPGAGPCCESCPGVARPLWSRATDARTVILCSA